MDFCVSEMDVGPLFVGHFAKDGAGFGHFFFLGALDFCAKVGDGFGEGD